MIVFAFDSIGLKLMAGLKGLCDVEALAEAAFRSLCNNCSLLLRFVINSQLVLIKLPLMDVVPAIKDGLSMDENLAVFTFLLASTVWKDGLDKIDSLPTCSPSVDESIPKAISSNI